MVKKIDIFRVDIDGNKDVFFAGDEISGSVTLQVNKPMKCSLIDVKLAGLSYCYWTTERTTGSDTNNLPHRDYNVHVGRQELLQKRAVVFSGYSSTQNKYPPGKQIYRFTFNLPNHLPSSFEGSIGFIRYYIEVEIYRPRSLHSTKPNHKVRKHITVMEKIDMTTPVFLTAPRGSRQQQIGNLCCVSGNVSMQAKLDKSGYCPGEHILIQAEVENDSSRDLVGMKASLVQTTTFCASNARRRSSKEIGRVYGRQVAAGNEQYWKSHALPVPLIPPTIYTRPVQVSYAVIFKVKIPREPSLNMALNITVGTAELPPSYDTNPPQYSAQGQVRIVSQG